MDSQILVLKSLFGDLFAKMVAFALEDEFQDALGESLVCFYNLSEGEEYEFVPSEEFLFLAWFLFDDMDAADLAMVDEFEKRFSDTLSLQEKQICKALKGTCLSLMQVLAVIPGESIRLRDVFLGEEISVCESVGSNGVVNGSLLFSRVLRLGDSCFLVGAGVFLDAAIHDPLTKFIKERYHQQCEEGNLVSFREFLKLNGETINWWIRALEEGRTPEARPNLNS